MPDWDNQFTTIGLRLWAKDDCQGEPKPREADPDGDMWAMWGIFGRGIHERPPPYSERLVRPGKYRPTVVAPPPHPP